MDLIVTLYNLLLVAFTEDDWKRAKGIATNIWKKMRSDSITDEVLDDIIKTFLYRAAQKISRGAAYEDEVGPSHQNNRKYAIL